MAKSDSGYFSLSFSNTSSWSSLFFCALSSLAKVVATISVNLSLAIVSISLTNSASKTFSTTSILGLPTASLNSCWITIIFLIASWAILKALNKSSSKIFFDSPSTINKEVSVPATTNSISLCSICWFVGLTINSPSILPTLTWPTGSRKGMLEIWRAAEAPIAANTSVSFSPSKE